MGYSVVGSDSEGVIGTGVECVKVMRARDDVAR